MTQQTINSTPGGPDDTLPQGAAKINGNFTELYTALQQGAQSTLRQVSARCGICDTFSSANKQMQTRTFDKARDRIAQIQVIYPNWYVTFAAGEVGTGGSATLTLGLEYPIGTTPVQITFGGVAQGTAADGANFVSDLMTLATPIPEGAEFAWHAFYNNAAGIPYKSYGGLTQTTNSGEVFNFAASGLTDTSLTTTFAQTSSIGQLTYQPVAVLSYSNKPAIAYTGDSIGAGLLDYVLDRSSYPGVLQKNLGKRYAGINLCVSSDRLTTALTSYTRRSVLAAYCQIIVCEYGNNDLFSANRSAAQLQADAVSFSSLLGNKPFFQTTITPRSNLTNTATTNSTAETQRRAFNAAVRRSELPFVGYIEVSDVVEDRDAGIWKIDQIRRITDGAVTGGQSTFTSATANFTTADAGKIIAIAGAGTAGATLYATILRVTNATTVTFPSAAVTTVTNAVCDIGFYSSDGIHPGPFTYALVSKSGNVSIDSAATANPLPVSYTRTIGTQATLDFPSTAAGATSTLTVTLVGADLGDEIILGVPLAAVTNPGIFQAYVSAANTVTVTFSNPTTATALDPASGVFRVSALKR